MKSRRNPAASPSGRPPLRTADNRPRTVSGGDDERAPQPAEIVAGRERLRLEFSDERLFRLIGRYIEMAATETPDRGQTRSSTPDRDGHEDPLTIRLMVVGDDRAPADGDCVEDWSGAPPRFMVRFGQQLETTVDVDGALIDGWVSAGLLDGSPQTAGRLLIEAPLAAFRAAHGWQAVHAATLTGPSGAVVIRGPSDSGKSTLAAAAWKAGIETLGDESVLVRRPAHDEVAASVREVHLRPRTAEMLDLQGDPISTSAGEFKVRLPLEPIPSSRRSANHAATVLLGANDRPGGARLVPLCPEEFVAGFAAGEIPQESWYGSSESLLRTWARRPAFRLDGAVDLEGAVALLGRLCRGEVV